MRRTETLNRFDAVLGVLLAVAIATLFVARDYNDLSDGSALGRDDRLVSGFGLTFWYGLPLLAVLCAGVPLLAGRWLARRLGMETGRTKAWAMCLSAGCLVAWALYYVLGTESARLN